MHNHRRLTALAAATLIVTLPIVAIAASGVEVHYAPVENLEHVDVDLLDSAEERIDFAAFVLTDRAIIDSLNAAATRGVAVRILLDSTQPSDKTRLADLRTMVRVKPHTPIMHLKSYTVDGKILRTGSANFSGGGLKHQDNDLVVVRDENAASTFTSRFDEMFKRAEPMRLP
jgi:phosphatidylserine/phosphatidylglycerophosphate/cardiolipin synthase-like enzyme